MDINFTEADEAHIAANHISADDPEAYEEWCHELQEDEDQRHARARVNKPMKKLRQYR